MNPLAQSGSSIRADIMSIMRSSGISCPASMISFAFFPRSLPEATSARNMSPVESWTMPKLSSIRFACVPLPAPGAPSKMIFIRVAP